MVTFRHLRFDVKLLEALTEYIFYRLVRQVLCGLLPHLVYARRSQYRPYPKSVKFPLLSSGLTPVYVEPKVSV